VVVVNDLSEKLQKLWDEQKHEWPMMQRGVDFLAQSETRDVLHGGLCCRLQFNPGRVASASAKVDAKSIAERPCFLCEKNRPSEQRGIDAGDGYVFLCNPMPIFDPHFTVPTLEHQPQRIASCLAKMLELAERLSGKFTVFYNGPKCGASAPDHLHLQASPQGATPLEMQLVADSPGFIIWQDREGEVELEVEVGVTSEPEPPAIVIAGHDRAKVQQQVEKTIARLTEHFPADPEPMLNALALMSNGKFHAMLFPRASHRPSNFGHEASPENVLVSPGLVDMLGMLITPRREDFDNLTGEAVVKIYEEVSRERSKLTAITSP